MLRLRTPALLLSPPAASSRPRFICARRESTAATPPAASPAPGAAPSDSAAACAPSEPSASPEDALRSRVRDLERELRSAYAQCDAARSVARAEAEGARAFALQAIARDIAEVSDNLDRAEQSARGGAGAGAVAEGIALTRSDMLARLARHGIERAEPRRGERFDPAAHLALFEAAPAPGVEPGTSGEPVVDVVVKPAFWLNGRLVRPAHVGVARGGKPKEPFRSDE
eukprot:m51a1_g7166 putative grpE (227) ;mRNA; f:56121-56801